MLRASVQRRTPTASRISNFFICRAVDTLAARCATKYHRWGIESKTLPVRFIPRTKTNLGTIVRMSGGKIITITTRGIQ
jgi:hypothetical protein